MIARGLAAAIVITTLIATLIATGVAAAQPATADGITFSDELGGFRVVSASGSGASDDPFVVTEEITGPGAAVLVIRGMTAAFGNRVGTLHPTGFAIRKVITNRTPFIWTFIAFELQETLGVPSDTYDGLSFGQGADAWRPFTSDRFVRTFETTDPLDNVTFIDGDLAPGETTVIDIVVTDTSPVPAFFLIQRPTRPVAVMARPWPRPW